MNKVNTESKNALNIYKYSTSKEIPSNFIKKETLTQVRNL